MARLRKSGGYRKLASFQTTTMIYDVTVWFCEKFVDSRSRTVDQMIQAARSGRQNIAEGSRAAATSSQTELRLVNVARASLEELLLDYEDYLRHRRLPLWKPDSPEATAVRRVASNWKKDRTGFRDRPETTDRSDPTDSTDRNWSDRTNPSDRPSLTELSDQERWALYSQWLDNADASIRANAVICLIHQANFLLDQQIDALEREFIDDGGYSEQLATARLQKRNELRQQQSQVIAQHNQVNAQHHQAIALHHQINDDGNRDGSQTSDSKAIPNCPQCGGLMALRTAKSGRNVGSQFWGCTKYPQCKGTVAI